MTIIEKPSSSIEEEIIAGMWTLAAVLCFGFGFTFFGWIFTIKAVLDHLCCIYMAMKELKAVNEQQGEHSK